MVNDSIILNGAIPKLVYGGNTITNGVLNIDTKDNALVYNLVDDIQNNQSQLLTLLFLEKCKTIPPTIPCN
jgi:hypothetical protein